MQEGGCGDGVRLEKEEEKETLWWEARIEEKKRDEKRKAFEVLY